MRLAGMGLATLRLPRLEEPAPVFPVCTLALILRGTFGAFLQEALPLLQAETVPLVLLRWAHGCMYRLYAWLSRQEQAEPVGLLFFAGLPELAGDFAETAALVQILVVAALRGQWPQACLRLSLALTR